MSTQVYHATFNAQPARGGPPPRAPRVLLCAPRPSAMPPKRGSLGRPAEEDASELQHDELRRMFSNEAAPLPPPESMAAEPEPESMEPEPEPDASSAATPPVVVTPMLVAAASTNSWKLWAGRSEGGDGFQVSDLFVGTAHAWGNYRRSWKGDRRSPGKECPVCFDDDPLPDAAGKRWMRLYCGCTVCSGCVRNWNVSEISGDSTGKKLSCPVCLAEMRPHDAAETLTRCSSAAKALDIKARDAALRGMADSDTGLQEWHPCPHCETGGGFVTAECIAGRHGALRRVVEDEEREELRHVAAKAEAETVIAEINVTLARADADWTRRASNRTGETAAIMCGAPLAACGLAASGCSRLFVAVPATAALFFAIGHKLCSPSREKDYEARQRLSSSRQQHTERAAKQHDLAEQHKAAAQQKREELLEVGACCMRVPSEHSDSLLPCHVNVAA